MAASGTLKTCPSTLVSVSRCSTSSSTAGTLSVIPTSNHAGVHSQSPVMCGAPPRRTSSSVLGNVSGIHIDCARCLTYSHGQLTGCVHFAGLHGNIEVLLNIIRRRAASRRDSDASRHGYFRRAANRVEQRIVVGIGGTTTDIKSNPSGGGGV